MAAGGDVGQEFDREKIADISEIAAEASRGC